MYFDAKPCRECGSEVELRPRTSNDRVVTEADPTVDKRICTNPECRTHDGGNVPQP